MNTASTTATAAAPPPEEPLHINTATDAPGVMLGKAARPGTLMGIKSLGRRRLAIVALASVAILVAVVVTFVFSAWALVMAIWYGLLEAISDFTGRFSGARRDLCAAWDATLLGWDAEYSTNHEAAVARMMARIRARR